MNYKQSKAENIPRKITKNKDSGATRRGKEGLSRQPLHKHWAGSLLITDDVTWYSTSSLHLRKHLPKPSTSVQFSTSYKLKNKTKIC